MPLTSTNALLMSLTLTAICMSGCDPVGTVRQSIAMRVLNEDGLPDSGTKIRMKVSWESWSAAEGAMSRSETENRHKHWLETNWLEGVTNQEGKALLWQEVTALDGNKDNTPFPDRDGFYNREYVIRLLQNDVKTDVTVVLKPGLFVKAGDSTLAIVAIGEPVYVEDSKTKDCTRVRCPSSNVI